LGRATERCVFLPAKSDTRILKYFLHSFSGYFSQCHHFDATQQIVLMQSCAHFHRQWLIGNNVKKHHPLLSTFQLADIGLMRWHKKGHISGRVISLVVLF